MLSIYQTDVVVYGDDLLDYLRREFLHDNSDRSPGNDLDPSDPWLELALRD